MDLPEHPPGSATVIAAFPVPLKFTFLDCVVPDHPLPACLSPDSGIAHQDHPVLFKFPCELEIRSVAVRPCQIPFTEPEIELVFGLMIMIPPKTGISYNLSQR
jgi:hypothetical protein